MLQRLTPASCKALMLVWKALGLMGLLVVTTLLRSFTGLALSYALLLLLAVMSRVPARRLAAALIAAPLFSAAIMLPATLSVITPGKALLVIVPSKLAITDAGLAVAARFILRAAVCVSIVGLLTVTTQRVKLFRGLRMLGVPQIFVTLLSMMERYLGILVISAEEIHLAKISRSIAPGSLRQEKAWAAAGMGSLFRRSCSLGHAVYLAMVSRGYTGEVHCLEDPVLREKDWAFALAAAILCAVLLYIG